jgi:hypothetical protein
MYFLLSISVLLSVGREPTLYSLSEEGRPFYNALTAERFMGLRLIGYFPQSKNIHAT